MPLCLLLQSLLPSLLLPGWVLVPGLPCDGLVCDFGVMSLSLAQMALGLGEPVAAVVQGPHLARPFASSKPWTRTFWLAPVVSQVCVRACPVCERLAWCPLVWCLCGAVRFACLVRTYTVTL